MLIKCGRAARRERGSIDAVLLLSGALVGLIAWHAYQRKMLTWDQQRFDAFTQRVPLDGVEFDGTVWPLPLPPRTDYGAQSNKLYSTAECAVRRLLPHVSEEGLPRCP